MLNLMDYYFVALLLVVLTMVIYYAKRFERIEKEQENHKHECKEQETLNEIAEVFESAFKEPVKKTRKRKAK